jgi:CxxC motif-containing protein (DUF1111 family)
VLPEAAAVLTRCATSRSTCTPTCCCTTWARAWARRCGGWASGSSFLHDGRTGDLRQAVLAHRSEGSEANGVIARYVNLADREEQDLLNFLRSL